MTELRNQWIAITTTYGNSPRWAGAAKVANDTHPTQTADWYATAIAVFWS